MNEQETHALKQALEQAERRGDDKAVKGMLDGVHDPSILVALAMELVNDKSFHIMRLALKRLGAKSPKMLIRVLEEGEDWVARKSAAEFIEDQDALLTAACGDEKNAVRAAAALRLTDPALRMEIAKNDKDEYVRWELVSTMEEPSALADFAKHDASSMVREKAVRKLMEPDPLIFVALHDADPSICETAIARLIASPESLCRIAIEAAREKVALLAVRRLSERELLERAAKEARLPFARSFARCKLGGGAVCSEDVEILTDCARASNDTSVIRAVCGCLASLNCVDDLLRCAREGGAFCRHRAVKSLSGLHGSEGALLDLLRANPDEALLRAAVNGVHSLSGLKALYALAKENSTWDKIGGKVDAWLKKRRRPISDSKDAMTLVWLVSRCGRRWTNAWTLVRAIVSEDALLKLTMETGEWQDGKFAEYILTMEKMLKMLGLTDADDSSVLGEAEQAEEQTHLARLALRFPLHEVRRCAVKRLRDQETLKQVVISDEYPSICEAALERVEDQAFIEHMAINANSRFVLNAAALRAMDQQTLEQIARAVKNPYDLYSNPHRDQAGIRAISLLTNRQLLKEIAQSDGTRREIQIAAQERLAELNGQNP